MALAVAITMTPLAALAAGNSGGMGVTMTVVSPNDASEQHFVDQIHLPTQAKPEAPPAQQPAQESGTASQARGMPLGRQGSGDAKRMHENAQQLRQQAQEARDRAQQQARETERQARQTPQQLRQDLSQTTHGIEQRTGDLLDDLPQPSRGSGN